MTHDERPCKVETLSDVPGRVIVVGDLHGMRDMADELLKKCSIGNTDTVVFLGDLVDRGPDAARSVDLVREIEQRQGRRACVLGNHEEKHLSYEDIFARKGNVNVNAPTHVATRLQLDAGHYDYFRSLPDCIRLPQFSTACVHAGAWPDRRLEDQRARHLLHIQSIQTSHAKRCNGERSLWPSRVPEQESKDWAFWTNLWTGPERLIFGHSVLDAPLLTDNVCGIDGGACFGLSLHAVILPEWRIVSVGSSGDDSGDRSRRNGRINKFLVHGNVSTFS